MMWVFMFGGCVIVVRIVGFSVLYSLLIMCMVNLFVVLVVFILIWFGFLIGLLDSMINFFIVVCVLKVMLVEKKCDFYFFICVCLFLIGCGFILLFSVFVWFGYMGILVLLFFFIVIYYGVGVFIKKSIIFVGVFIL